ncbi:MAG: helix-turn-helix transcriptional regulator [Chlamydiales bacterium]|nr:helix-turn-helix transcriptional regulator [Chlamydiales bacterium]
MKVNVTNPFSKRETDVAHLLLMGSPTSSEIADKLFLSKRTIDDHMVSIKDKLGCCTKSQMMQKLKELESFGLLF